MKIIKKIGIFLSLFGLIMYIPPIMKSLTLYFGHTVGLFGGIVFFAIGWSVLGAGLAFSAGINYQRGRLKKEL